MLDRDKSSADRFVMVADDSALNRTIVRELLEAKGYSVDIAEDGVEALALVKGARPYEIVLMDLNMPIMDGFTCATEIRRLQGRRGQVPILGLSTVHVHNAVEHAISAGMNGHVIKPFRPYALFDAITKTLFRAEQSIDGKVRHEIWATACFDEWRQSLRPARVGQALLLFMQQLERARLVVESDECSADVVAATAHSLVGSAGFLGFNCLRAASEATQVVETDEAQRADWLMRLQALRNAIDTATETLAAFLISDKIDLAA